MAATERVGKFDVALGHCNKTLNEIFVAAKRINQSELVNLCSKVDGLLDSIDSNITTPTTVNDGSSGKNHAYRFSLGDSRPGAKKASAWGFKPSRKSIFGLSSSESQDYEDVVNEDILKAPVCDICFVTRNDPLPEGFYRVAKTPGNHKANFNSGAGGKTLYLCIKKDLSGDQIPIVNLIVVFPDKNEIVPPGFFVVRRGAQSCNVNMGTNSERVFVCYKKDKWGNPITDVQLIFPGKDESVPQSFSLVDFTASDLPADLNAGTGGNMNKRFLTRDDTDNYLSASSPFRRECYAYI